MLVSIIYTKYFKISVFIIIILSGSSCDKNITNENLINKVNAVESQWVNYNGTNESDNQMMKSQFIPYNAEDKYLLNNDAYVSYYNGGNFIKTKLHEGNDSVLQTVEEADGVILSFSKENKNGIKLVTTD